MKPKLTFKTTPLVVACLTAFSLLSPGCGSRALESQREEEKVQSLWDPRAYDCVLSPSWQRCDGTYAQKFLSDGQNLFPFGMVRRNGSDVAVYWFNYSPSTKVTWAILIPYRPVRSIRMQLNRAAQGSLPGTSKLVDCGPTTTPCTSILETPVVWSGSPAIPTVGSLDLWIDGVQEPTVTRVLNR